MKLTRLSFVVILLLCLIQIGFSQITEKIETTSKPKAELINSSGYINSEMASLNIDILRNAVRDSPNSKGLIAVYCGKACQYGQIEAHIRGVSMALKGKGIKSDDIVFVQGGFKKELTIEYWLIPEIACPPILNSTVDIEDVVFKGTFKKQIVAYDCC